MCSVAAPPTGELLENWDDRRLQGVLKEAGAAPPLPGEQETAGRRTLWRGTGLAAARKETTKKRGAAFGRVTCGSRAGARAWQSGGYMNIGVGYTLLSCYVVLCRILIYCGWTHTWPRSFESGVKRK